MPLDGVSKAGSDPPASAMQSALYLSLSGGCAWVVITVPAIAVCISYLQRHEHAPQHKHLVGLSRLVRYLHRLVSLNKHVLVFRHLDPPLSLVAAGDSAYAAGEFEALVLRGGFVFVDEEKF